VTEVPTMPAWTHSLLLERAHRPPASPAGPTGLRKPGATDAPENGATPLQLMAIFGWNTLALAYLAYCVLTSNTFPNAGELSV